MADLQSRIDALVDAATAMSAAALAPLRAFVARVVDSIGDLTQFEGALNAALLEMGDTGETPVPQWRLLLERLMLAALLIGREAVAPTGQRIAAATPRPVPHPTGETPVPHQQMALAESFDSLPFDEAIAASMDRIVLPRSAFDRLEAEAKSRAFTFAWQDSVKVLTAAHQAHLETLAKGGTLRDFRLGLPAMFEAEGWAGDRPWHADLVHRQQSQMAYNAGRFEQMSDTGVTHWRYSALQDSRTRPTHAALDGKVFAMTDRRFYPPWEFNCRCAAEPVFDDEVDQVDRSQELEGEGFARPDGTRSVPATFEWDPASFARVDPLRLASVPPGMRAAIRRVLDAQGVSYEEDTEDERALSEKVRKWEGEKVKMRELILISDADLAAAPARFRVCPWGTVETKKGNYVMDDVAAREIIANFRRGGVDVVIDRDHATLGGKFATPDGSAPAMGWITDLEAVPGDGLYALANWTPPGREALSNRTYRYPSPVLRQREADLRPVYLHSMALTNKPATLHADALVNKDDDPVADDRSGSGAGAGNSQKEVPMKGIATLLALKEDASETDVMGAIKALSEKAAKGEATQATLTLVCSELGVGIDQPAEKIRGAVLELKGSAETIKVLSSEVKGLRDTVAGQQADSLILSAKKAGKLLDAQEPWARELILADKGRFEKWLETAPVVRQQGQTQAPPAGAAAGAGGGGGEGSRDRKTIALSARDEHRAKPELRQLVASEEKYVNGQVLSAGYKALSDDDVKELQLIG